MNVNLSGMIPGQLGQMPKNMGAVSTKGISFVNLLDSMMAENIPGPAVPATTVDNPGVSGEPVNLLDMIVNGTDLKKSSDPVTGVYEQLGLKEIEITEKDKKDTDDNLMASLEVISQYLNYVPKVETDSYEVLKSDDSVKIFNDLINQSKPKSDSMQSLKMQEQQNPAQEKLTIDVPMTEGIKEISTYAENLIIQIENNRNKFRDEIDLNAGLAQKNKIMFSENKTIQVSDESSYIKSSAISQIKDKIELMVSEGTNGTKEVTMELRPENLGKVNIKMFYEGSKLTVEIKALDEETSKLLMSNSQELAKLLNKTADSNVNVVVKHESAYGQNPLDYNQDQGKNQQKSNYTYSGKNQDDKDDDMFSQIMKSTAS
jgi:flagellar hook-length control protein FliK